MWGPRSYSNTSRHVITGARGRCGRRRVSSSSGGTLEHTGVKASVSAGVLGEVIASHEAFVAERAHETLLPGVRTKVSCQFI